MLPSPPHDLDVLIRRFCERWRPERVAEQDALQAILAEYGATLTVDDAPYVDYLKLLVASHPEGRTRADLATALNLEGADQASVRLYQLRGRLNRDLMALFSNPLQYQVYVVPDQQQAPELAELERREVLRPLSAFTLLGRTRAAPHADPRLREGCAQYDRGDYLDCAGTLVHLLPEIHRPGRMTVGELTLLLYHLAKTLLKLNWYGLLDSLLTGPYQRFSTEVVNGDLEAERLQIMAIGLRQRSRPADAAACLREAVRLLQRAVMQHRHPAIALTLADSEVLLVQTSLDEVVDQARPAEVRRLRLREAHDALSRAKRYYEQWWSEAQAPEPVHYEGRLNGTAAFLTVARSVLEPATLTSEDWKLAERNARMGYEPARYRKPFGVVAGHYAHATVLLAKAHWHHVGRDSGTAEESVVALRAGKRLLQSARKRYLDTGEVTLGGAYEGPRFYRLLEIFDNLLSNGLPSLWPDPRTAALLTPLV